MQGSTLVIRALIHMEDWSDCIMLSNEDIKFVEKHLDFWEKLSRKEKTSLLNNITPIKYSMGDSIHRGENDCIGIMLVKSGRLRTYILSEEGKEPTLFRLNEGEVCVLSASCMLRSITFDVHIDAEKDSEIFAVNTDVFEQLCNDNIYVENFSHKTTTTRFSDVMWAMEQILFMSFEKRLAIFLIDQSSLDNSEYISMTHEAIAHHMGSAREVVSRMLKYFQGEGLVELSRGDIKIIDKNKLRSMAMQR